MPFYIGTGRLFMGPLTKFLGPKVFRVAKPRAKGNRPRRCATKARCTGMMCIGTISNVRIEADT